MERQAPQPHPVPQATRAPSLGRLAAPLLLMALMWFLSSQPDLSTGLGLADLVGRKIVHAASFGALCLLWWRALPGGIGAAALAVPFLVAAGYGAVDEYHQTFVAGRVGSPIDVAIDAAGAAIAVVLIRRRSRARRRCRTSEADAPPPAAGARASRAR